MNDLNAMPAKLPRQSRLLYFSAAAALLLVISLLAGLVYLVLKKQAAPGAMGAASATSSSSSPSTLPVDITQFVTGTESMPASLQGTEVDGEIEVDENGHLRVTRRLKDLFDYFLSAQGEETRPVLAARVRAYLKSRLKDPALSEALNLFSRYLAYLDAGQQQVASHARPPSLDGDLAAASMASVENEYKALAALRKQFFSPAEITAMFGENDQYNAYQLARMKIQADTRLDPQQKAELVSREFERLPENLKSAMSAEIKLDSLQSLTRELKEKGGTPEELHKLREQLVGPEATARLEQLDTEEDAWLNRIKQFESEKAVIEAGSGDKTAKQQQVQQLMQQRFSKTEQLRIETFEQMKKAGLSYGDL